MKNYIKTFLKANGFKLIEKNSYANERCNIVIDSDGFAVANNDGDTMYSKDHNIFWLIGVLTWYNFVDKNYNN